ncbi:MULTISPECIES: hypothetical protein [Streptomyces]|uniref:Uncharacterized protein n=1 Tax=Streptomyces mordarskii TaxID=1226758 RepID=A0ABP3MW18_9ACTN|nr:hypothetical protein [Streptomyces sp. AgN23]WTA81971.1 hypothetical protein OG751_19885 [Streptomyces antimycoticus]WTB07557.1 hypothetical protein OG546_27040 [Streptomyces antimycoticus]
MKSLEGAIVVTLAKSGEGHAEAVRPRAVRGHSAAKTASADAGRECSWVKPRRC